MYEVEVKVEAAHEPVRQRLAALGAEPLGGVRQRDTYLDHPVRSFAETDEALRLRRESPRTGDGTPAPPADETASATLTYKGPRVDDVSKTRREVETGVADPGALLELLSAVGFEPAAAVEKVRERFAVGDYVVALDRVEGLGAFVEVEAVASEDELEARREGAFDLLGRLGLDRADVTSTSYLALLLEADAGPAGGDGLGDADPP